MAYGVIDFADPAALSNATPQPIGTATSGTGTSASRDDHVHAHGNQLGGALHANATPTAGTNLAGFMSAADKTKVDALATTYLPLTGGSLTGALNEAQGADIESATTTDIGAATGNYLVVTGVTTITGLGTVQAGTRRIVKFSGALLLTYNATSLILPSAADITTVAGDVATFVSLGSRNWICVDYSKVSTTGTGSTVLATSPTLVTPSLGTPTALVATNATGTAAGLTAGAATLAVFSTASTINSITGSPVNSDQTPVYYCKAPVADTRPSSTQSAAFAATYTIAASRLKIGSKLRIVIGGAYTAVALNTNKLTLTLSVGSLNLVVLVSTAVQTTTDTFRIDVDVTVSSITTNYTVNSCANCWLGTSGAGTLSSKVATLNQQTITTVSNTQLVRLLAAWDSNATLNTVRLDMFQVEII